MDDVDVTSIMDDVVDSNASCSENPSQADLFTADHFDP